MPGAKGLRDRVSRWPVWMPIPPRRGVFATRERAADRIRPLPEHLAVCSACGRRPPVDAKGHRWRAVGRRVGQSLPRPMNHAVVERVFLDYCLCDRLRPRAPRLVLTGLTPEERCGLEKLDRSQHVARAADKPYGGWRPGVQRRDIPNGPDAEIAPECLQHGPVVSPELDDEARLAPREYETALAGEEAGKVVSRVLVGHVWDRGIAGRAPVDALSSEIRRQLGQVGSASGRKPLALRGPEHRRLAPNLILPSLPSAERMIIKKLREDLALELALDLPHNLRP
jgi:hypothetical protein